MTHTEQLRARVIATEQRIAHQVERLKRLNALGGAGFEQAAEALRRLGDIRDAYRKILSGPCPLTGERPVQVDLLPD